MSDLKIVSGPSRGKVVPIDRELVLGREGDVVIDDREVSRRHAVIRPVPGGLEIEDLGSANGTFVDERRIAGREVVTGFTRLALGTTEIELRVAPEATQAQAPAAPPTVVASAPSKPTPADDEPPEPPAETATGPAAAPGPPSRPPAPVLLGAAAGVVTLALIVLFALAARGDSIRTHKIKLKIRTTELYFVGARIGFSGTIVGEPFGAGTITQDQTFGGRPQDILKGPTPVTAKVTARFAKGTIVGTLRATATPTKAGGTHLDGKLTWAYGTGAYKNIRGSITTTGGRPDIRVPIAAFDTTGEVDY